MNIRSVLIAVLAVSAVGCGGPGSFDGEVDGNGLTVRDAVFVPLKGETGEVAGVVLALSDSDELCAMVKANKKLKEGSMASFTLFRISDDGEQALVPTSGEYTVSDNLFEATPGNVVFGGFTKADASCTSTIANDRAGLKSGTVKVDALELKADGTMSGTFDVTFGAQGDKVTGSFTATYCDAPTTTEPATCE